MAANKPSSPFCCDTAASAEWLEFIEVCEAISWPAWCGTPRQKASILCFVNGGGLGHLPVGQHELDSDWLQESPPSKSKSLDPVMFRGSSQVSLLMEANRGSRSPIECRSRQNRSHESAGCADR